MPVFISLIRGINVGGNKTIKMTALKALYESLGFTSVSTHLNSGNVVFLSRNAGAGKLAKLIEDAIEKEFAFRPMVILRTSAEFGEVVAKGPFKKEQKSDPSHVLVMFPASRPAKDAETRLAETYKGPERFRIAADNLYLHYPDGIARSKLTNALLEKQLGAVGTARNWNTVTRLLEIAEALEG